MLFEDYKKCACPLSNPSFQTFSDFSPATTGHIFIHTVWESLLLMFSKTEQHFKSLNDVCLSHWHITFCKAVLKPCSLCSFDFINLHLSQMLSCVWQLQSRSLRSVSNSSSFWISYSSSRCIEQSVQILEMSFLEGQAQGHEDEFSLKNSMKWLVDALQHSLRDWTGSERIKEICRNKWIYYFRCQRLFYSVFLTHKTYLIDIRISFSSMKCESWHV